MVTCDVAVLMVCQFESARSNRRLSIQELRVQVGVGSICMPSVIISVPELCMYNKHTVRTIIVFESGKR